MCGRFTQMMTWSELVALYGLGNRKPPASNLEPRYNLAPTQRAPVIRLNAEGEREGVDALGSHSELGTSQAL